MSYFKGRPTKISWRIIIPVKKELVYRTLNDDLFQVHCCTKSSDHPSSYPPILHGSGGCGSQTDLGHFFVHHTVPTQGRGVYFFVKELTQAHPNPAFTPSPFSKDRQSRTIEQSCLLGRIMSFLSFLLLVSHIIITVVIFFWLYGCSLLLHYM